MVLFKYKINVYEELQQRFTFHYGSIQIKKNI